MSAIDPGTPPEPVVAAEPVAPVVPAVPASPWAADAAAYFGDDATAAANFDRYMREKQQPYVTQLEESTKDAREYYDDLHNDTDATIQSLVASRYGDEFAAEYIKLFGTDEPVVTEPVAAEPEVIPEWAKPIVESHQEKVDRELRESESAAYAAFKEGLKEPYGLTDDDLGVIDVFIHSSPADPAAAVAAYRAWQAKAGIVVPEVVVPTPPPVLGDGATTAATPPLATQYKTYDQIGDAIKGFVSRQAASSTPPPVVG
jgi:hypothetical protein